MIGLGLSLGLTLGQGRRGDRSPIAFTSAADGDWNSPATWTSGEDYPRLPGDTVTISSGDEITIPTGLEIEVGAVTFEAGTNSTTDRTQIIINGSLRLHGDITLNGITSIIMGPGATFDLGGYDVSVIATDVRYTFAGTPSNHCTVRSTGGRGQFLNTNVYLLLPTIDYTDFSGLGDSVIGRSQTSAVTPHVEHCTFTDMEDLWIDRTGANANVGLSFQYCDIRNPYKDKAKIGVRLANQPLGTNPRVIANNTHYSDNGNRTWFTLENTDGITTSPNTLVNAGFSTTVGRETVTSTFFADTVNIDETFFSNNSGSASITNSYFYIESGAHPLGYLSDGRDLTFTGNVCEQGLGIAGAGTNWLLWSTMNSSVDVSISDNLGIGVGFGALCTTVTGANSPATFSVFGNTIYGTNHDLVQAGPVKFPMIFLGEGTSTLNGVPQVYNNLVYNTGPPTYAQDRLIDMQSANVDQFALVDYNGAYPDAAVYRNVTITGSVGANDINVDPVFADPTRCFATWDASLGGPGTAANALAEMVKINQADYNPDYNLADLRAWVRAGFVPTGAGATAYDGTGLSGGNIGMRP